MKYRIQHESIPLTEEKQILREIKQLEGTRDKVIANAAMRAKIQDSLGQKEAIQDQVKVRDFIVLADFVVSLTSLVVVNIPSHWQVHANLVYL